MDLLDKLTEILNHEEINNDVKNIINNINKEDLETYLYFQSNLTLEYDNFINIWNDFVYKTIFYYDNMNCIINKSLDITIEILLKEPELGNTIEYLFTSHLNAINDSLLVIYLRNNNKLLLMLKSFTPLLNVKSIQLPFWNYIIPHDNLGDLFDESFEENETICFLVVNLKNIK